MQVVPLVWWLAVCAGLAAGGVPVAARLFPRLPDRGAAFAFPIGLGVVTLVTLWVGHLRLRLGTVAGAVVLATLAVQVSSGVPETPRAWLRERSREWLPPLVVFAVAFLLLLAVRAADPAIVPAGGEKFLDYSLVRAVLRAEALPLEDPWFAGEQVRYYYGGPLAVGILTELSGVRPAVAYNLAVATAYAALATAAYGLAAAVADAIDLPPVAAGGLGALLTAFGGPLSTPARAALGLVPRDLAAAYGGPLVAGIRAAPEDALASVRFLAHGTVTDYNPWIARYVVPDVPNVFPMWTFVNGDLRAHMIGPPFLLLVGALAFACHRSTDRRRRLALLGAITPVGGLIAVVNTWSLPVVGGLVTLSVAAGEAPPRDLLPARLRRRLPAPSDGLLGEGARAVTAAGVGLVVVAVAALWATPFLIGPTPTNRGVALLPPRSPFVPFAFFHGGFLLLFAVALLPRLGATLGGVGRSAGRLAAVGVGLVAVVALALVPAAGAVTLVALFVLGGWVLARRTTDYVSVLVVAGAGLLVVGELLTARVYPYDPNAQRWNTLYKLNVQVWVLWGPAAGVAAVAALSRARSGLSATGTDRLRGGAVAALVVLVVLGAATFGALATTASLAPATDRPLSLDGTAYVDTYHGDAAPVIEWLDDRPGTPTLVSRPGERPYTWQNAPSSLTGVPTVVGWTHQVGYRGETAYRERVADVETLYMGAWSQRPAAIERYDIEYVYVGPNEREAYGVTVEEFRSRPGISVAVQQGTVTLLAVDRSEFPD